VFLFSPVCDASKDRLPHYEAAEDEEDVGRVGLSDAVCCCFTQTKGENVLGNVLVVLVVFYVRINMMYMYICICMYIYIYICLYGSLFLVVSI